jgi:hypothetical protein
MAAGVPFKVPEDPDNYGLYEIPADKGEIRAVRETTFKEKGITERYDLQRLLRTKIHIISPDIYVLAEEFGEWEDSKRRIDLLCLDRSANLVVVELKRTEDGGHSDLQALRYAAMVSRMRFDQAVEAHSTFLKQLGKDNDARKEILDFLEWEENYEDKFANKVRIILVSADFSTELTTAVLWLNDDHGLDIQCVRLRPYDLGERTLVDVQKIIPVPRSDWYRVQVGEKKKLTEIGRSREKELNQLYEHFFEPLIEKLKTEPGMDSVRQTAPPLRACACDSAIGVLTYLAVFRKGGKFRIELSLNDFPETRSSQVFRDLKEHSASFQQKFDEQLSWDAEKRMIFLSREGDIHDEENNLENLLNWAAKNLIIFKKAFDQELQGLRASESAGLSSEPGGAAVGTTKVGSDR